MFHKQLRLFVFAAPLVVLAGHAAAQERISICGERNGAKNELILTASNTCKSSSYRYKGHDLKFTVNHQRANIAITGNLQYESPRGPVVTMDCGGMRTVTFTAPGVAARRYIVMLNDVRLGVLDFTQSNARQCAGGMQKRSTLSIQQLRQTYTDMDIGKWPAKNTASLIGLFDSILRDHPDGMDGQQNLHLSVEKDGDAMRVEITMHGLLDDSVSGLRYVGIARMEASGWVLRALFRQHMCARGKTAGMWTKDACL